MNRHAFHVADIRREQCPECDGYNVHEMEKEQTFTYGTGERAFELTAKMPVFECRDCGFSFSDHRADKARQEAICRHEGVFNPEEITSIRTSAGLTRQEFASIGRFGTASLARWETGALAQNGANDQLIYLMQFPLVRTLLQARVPQETVLTGDVICERMNLAFRSLVTEQRPQSTTPRKAKLFRGIHDRQRLQQKAERFRLRTY
jgi:putative zinc finger/helix-turn-helix YgiT family protein